MAIFSLCINFPLPWPVDSSIARIGPKKTFLLNVSYNVDGFAVVSLELFTFYILLLESFLEQRSFARVLWFFPTSTLLVQVTLSKEAVLLQDIGFWCWDNFEIAEKKILFLRVKVEGSFWCSKSSLLNASVYSFLPLSQLFPTQANAFYFFVFVTWWNDTMISIVFRYLKRLLSFRRTSFVFL